MGRLRTTSSAAARVSSEPEFVPDDAGPLTDGQVASALGTDDDTGEAGAGTQDDTAARTTGNAATAAPPAKPKRKRGPNKPKPGLFTVVTEASMPQAEIVKLLASRAEELLGKEAAVGMELQVNVGGGWEPMSEAASHGVVVRFATKSSR